MLILIIAILLIVAVVYLVKIEGHLRESCRLQRAAISDDVQRRLQNEQMEATLFQRFIKEDFSRAEKGELEQQEEFRLWKITNA